MSKDNLSSEEIRKLLFENAEKGFMVLESGEATK